MNDRTSTYDPTISKYENDGGSGQDPEVFLLEEGPDGGPPVIVWLAIAWLGIITSVIFAIARW